LKKKIDLNTRLIDEIRQQVVPYIALILLCIVCFKILYYNETFLLLLIEEQDLQIFDTQLNEVLILSLIFLFCGCVLYLLGRCIMFMYYKQVHHITYEVYRDFGIKAKKMRQLRVPLKRIRANIDDVFPDVVLERQDNSYILYLYKNHWFNREQVEKNTDFFKSVIKIPLYKIEEDYNKISLIFTAEDKRLSYEQFLHFLDKGTILIGYDENQNPLYWDYNTVPHLLGVGTTGSGKSNFMKVLIDSLILMNAKIYFADGKRVELVNYRLEGYEVATDDFLSLFRRVHDMMTSRYRKMERESIELGAQVNHYTKLSFHADPIFLVIDEWASILDNLDREIIKGSNETEYKQAVRLLKDILQLGRAGGVQIISFMQDPKATTLDTALRNNFNMRVLLGTVKEKTAYDMLFGSEYRNLEAQQTGSGYYMSNDIPQVFKIPLVE